MAKNRLADVFIACKKAKKNEEKLTILRQAANQPGGNLALFYLLWLAFTDKVEWMIPEGVPPYKKWDDPNPEKGRPNRPGSEPSDLEGELRRLYLYLKASKPEFAHVGPGGEGLTQLKREKMFQAMLEGITTPEAEIIVAVKDKTLTKEFKISRALVDETFPGLFDAPIKLKFGTH